MRVVWLAHICPPRKPAGVVGYWYQYHVPYRSDITDQHACEAMIATSELAKSELLHFRDS
eukprot:scaffold456_cov171-Amphora_coffeaeformis.AAC.10